MITMQNKKIVFTSDLHGNEIQYRKLIEYANEKKPDYVIIGGDIAPKYSPRERLIENQRKFLKDDLMEILSEKDIGYEIFLMMGNDDCASNMDILEKESGVLFHLLDRRFSLTKEFGIVGYPYVPITPFFIKDWDKYDFSDTPEKYALKYNAMKRFNYNVIGLKSSDKGFINCCFSHDDEISDSIQKDLSKATYRKNPQKTVYVFHTPPYGTSLDMLFSGKHVGSMALAQFIEERQPYLTLHGHIHETVDISGKFLQKIGKTVCMSSGNDDMLNKIAFVEFDLVDPSGARRIIY